MYQVKITTNYLLPYASSETSCLFYTFFFLSFNSLVSFSIFTRKEKKLKKAQAQAQALCENGTAFFEQGRGEVDAGTTAQQSNTTFTLRQSNPIAWN